MSSNQNIFEQSLNNISTEAINLKSFYDSVVVDGEMGNVISIINAELDLLVPTCAFLIKETHSKDLDVKFYKAFQNELDSLSLVLKNQFPRFNDFSSQPEYSKNNYISIYQNSATVLRDYISSLKFTYDFFIKVNYFSKNIVCLGSNGSGKTSLSKKFKHVLGTDGVVISAQRFLTIPIFTSLQSPEHTKAELKNYQTKEKSNKIEGEFQELNNEFAVIVRNLLAEENSYNRIYKITAIENYNSGKENFAPLDTNLSKSMDIWNSLITHRKLISGDGFNIKVLDINANSTYDLISMSDGEKVLLYLIGHILQAPKDGFIVIDEPEMYLHKTILKKIWDVLEAERPDCLFIYLTHELDFATSRTDATKLWIKSFTFPSIWEIENIEENDIPEVLLMQLLGSKKDILFCEGNDKNSIDLRLYSLLFNNFTVIPLGSCSDVINYTKAFNKIQNINLKAFGIIDSDYSGANRILKLAERNIFCIHVAEAENLLLDEEFLQQISNLTNSPFLIDNVKGDILKKLADDIVIQASKFVSTKVNEYHKDSDVSKGQTLDILRKNLSSFQSALKIDEWYEERIKEIQKIIKEKDYSAAIKIFNHKSLINIAEKHLHITDLLERAIQLLNKKKDSHLIVLKHFPDELVKAGVA